jgi:hypothetical protein
MDPDKQYIIETFNKYVKDKEIIIKNTRHCGTEGHWLEKQMNIKPNGNNEPDIRGYEMKKDSKKITFGDYSASEYLFSSKKENINKYNGWTQDVCDLTRKDFIRTFGTKKPEKNNRFSWSGACIPKYNEYSYCGQKLIFDDNNNLCILYNHSEDRRDYKESFPDYLKKDNILIVFWEKNKLEQNINKKFNKKGFFICRKTDDKYTKICFGKTFNYEYFVENMKKKLIIFDSGMYETNSRNYSHFRSTNNKFWNELIIEEF